MTHPIRLLPELEPLINRPFGEKWLESIGLVAHNLMELDKNCAVAFSGGKDSFITTWLTTRFYPDIPVVFNNTGVEYPETVQFVHKVANEWKLNLIETKPEITFWDCVKKWGFPQNKHSKKGVKGSGVRHYCYYLKDKPMTLILKCLGAKGYFTGVTAVENRTRMFNARDKGTCYYIDGIKKVHPILYWTPDDVWSFIDDTKLPVNPVYFKGADRVGCSTCTAFMDWEKQLSTVNPKLYQLVKQHKNETTE